MRRVFNSSVDSDTDPFSLVRLPLPAPWAVLRLTVSQAIAIALLDVDGGMCRGERALFIASSEHAFGQA